MASKGENQITHWIYFRVFTFRWDFRNVCYFVDTGVGWLPFSQFEAMCDISFVTFMSKSRVVLHIPFRKKTKSFFAHSFLCSFSLYRIFSDFLKSNFSFIFLLSLACLPLTASLSLIFLFFLLFLCFSSFILLSLCYRPLFVSSPSTSFSVLCLFTQHNQCTLILCVHFVHCAAWTGTPTAKKKYLSFLFFHGIHMDYMEKSRCMWIFSEAIETSQTNMYIK